MSSQRMNWTCIGITVEEVKERTGFDLLIPENIYASADRRRTPHLRELDPDQRYTKPKEE